MSEKRSLLPPGSTPLERNLSVGLADIEDVPLPIRDIRRAGSCPVALLPWLAWERSVDRWDDNWPESVKRKVVDDSFFVHKRKGTVGAVRRVVEPLGYLLKVIEWWETNPPGPRGTAQISIGVLDQGITEQMYAELERLIADAWRLSVHLTGLAIQLESRATMSLCVSTYDGEELTVYPYIPGPIEIPVLSAAMAAEHSIDTLTVYPTP